MKTLKELLSKKSTKGEVVAVLALIHDAHGSVSVSAMASICGLELAEFKKTILTALLREGVLVIHNAKFRKKSPDAAMDVLDSCHIKHNLKSNVADVKAEASDEPEQITMEALDDFYALPKAKVLVTVLATSQMAVTRSDTAEHLGISKKDAKRVLSMLTGLGILKPYHNNTFKPANMSELCTRFNINQQTESTKAHNDTLVPWSWFTEDINRLRVVIKATTMDSQGRNIESVKASLIAGELGVQKREFINSYAPTLIKREVIAQLGKGYTRGARFKEYVRIITAEADAETPYIGGKREPRKLTAEQKRKAAQTTKTSIKQLEQRRAKAIEIADEWREGGLLTKKEHQMRVDDINAEYDALIQNLSQKEKKV